MEQKNNFRQRILPAIKHPSGTVKTGPRGAYHLEVRYNNPEPDGTVMRGDAGFYDPLEDKFYHKYGNRKDSLYIDSQRLEPEKSVFGKMPKEFENFKRLTPDLYHAILNNPNYKVA